MGTRHLISIIKSQETKVAQYGQWDGYPTGQGHAIVNFLRSKKRVEKLEKNLSKVLVVDDAKEIEIQNFYKEIGANNGWMNMGQAAKYKERYPTLSRDLCAGILEFIHDTKDKEIWVRDSSDFANDSLFCEWAYVIDLDNKVLEIYRGFNETPLEKTERYYTGKSQGGYYPIKFVEKFPFQKLPTLRELKKIEKKY